MITIEHEPRAYITVRASGVLSEKDYDAAIPELELAMEQAGAPIRALVLLEDFRGWDLKALWRELQFDRMHADDFSRIAVVGESRAEEVGTQLSQLMFKGEVRYFDRAALADARAWLAS